MVTIMGLYAKHQGIDLSGTKVRVTKEMIQQPVRRIGKLDVQIELLLPGDHPKRDAIEKAALTCPVHRSLHPDIEIPVNFLWR